MSELQEHDWNAIYSWTLSLRELSSSSDSYPVGPDSLLAGDDREMPPTASVAAIARTMLDSAVDHLATAIQVIHLSEQIPAASIPTLVRSTIEHAVLGMWLLTGDNRAGRQERALRIAHESEFNAAKFFRSITTSTSAPTTAHNESLDQAAAHQLACDEILRTADKLQLKRSRVKAPIGTTDILRGVDSTRGTAFLSYWQLCSGYAHGLAWAPSFFGRQLGTHELTGGGVLTAGDLSPENAMAMLHWGRESIQELQLSFKFARIDIPGHDEQAAIKTVPR